MADARSETSSIGDDLDSFIERPARYGGGDEGRDEGRAEGRAESRAEARAEARDEGRADASKEPTKSYTLHLVIGALWAVAVAVGGMIVGLFSRLTGKNALKTRQGSNYYDIVRPSIAPVPAFFVVIWTVFFLMYGMGGVAMIAPWLTRGVGTDKVEQTRLSLCVILYVAILGLLYAWMPVFANAEKPKTAAFLLVATVILYVPLLVLSAKTSWWSAALLAPLFGWLIVALVMNAESVQKWIVYKAKQVKQDVR
jgi:tryptophan-rich sensory protein